MDFWNENTTFVKHNKWKCGLKKCQKILKYKNKTSSNEEFINEINK
jgi:hypothetical protein